MFREAAESVSRTVQQSFVFTGRSRRLEVAYFWLASMLLNFVGVQVISAALDWDSAAIAREVFRFVIFVPFLALFARRLQDFGHSGWWVLCLLPIVANSLYESLHVSFHAFDPAWPDLGMWRWLLAIPVLASLAAVIIPGDVDENRYGSDPRLAQPEVRAV